MALDLDSFVGVIGMVFGGCLDAMLTLFLFEITTGYLKAADGEYIRICIHLDYFVLQCS